MNGYYMVIITKRRQVGSIGRHKIYSIEAVDYYYIPLEKSFNTAIEEKYLSLVMGFDLTKDFYFSYTYDLSRTLQYNMNPENHNRPFPQYNSKFVWNVYLMSLLLKKVLSSESPTAYLWILPVIHGYFSQAKMDVYGSSVELTLISRRLTLFAGTRYLKRGNNEQGYVANDVETEQILCEPNSGIQINKNFTSFVQHRGSIPLFWSQDNTGGVPKPPIEVQRVDPFYNSTILHFRDLLERYGSPIFVLNLVKAEEKNPRETLLKEGLDKAINFINSTVTEEDKKIIYMPWDFKSVSKDKAQVLRDLNTISQTAMQKTGFFHTGKQPYAHLLRDQKEQYNAGGIPYGPNRIGREQRGVLRSNCIDSLDRTNAAQYCVGQCALGYQLYALGLTQSPRNSFESDMSKLLMSLYEQSGHKLALQYGGSELAHTMSTWHTNKVLDTLTSIKRYYNNVFSDQEKQMSINLFLGVFRPSPHHPPIWLIETDYFLHMTRPLRKLLCNTEWWNLDISLEELEEEEEDEEFEVGETSLLHSRDFHNDEEISSSKKVLHNHLPTYKDIKEQFKAEFDEYYETDRLSEFDSVVDLDFNNIVRSSETTLPAISAINAERIEEEENPGLKWGISYWLRFDALKRKKKKAANPAVTQDSSTTKTGAPSLKSPLACYGITLNENGTEYNNYLNNVVHSNTSQYSSYLSKTHSKKPFLESQTENYEKFLESYSQDTKDPKYQQYFTQYNGQ
uniref:SAC domain-containing protein n=1 Tax=Arcella intermedia TaxID=1963864 RepID=A0A6B2KYA6_9EUKA